MTTKELYELIGSDYNNILRRLGSEVIIAKFAVKFLNDPSFGELETALSGGRTQDAFKAAHTLKGVAANLGFDKLYEVSSEITEVLRAGDLDGAKPLLDGVREKYDMTTAALKRFQSEN